MVDQRSLRVFIHSLVSNLGIAVLKFVGAGVTGAVALQAEALHSLATCSSQLLLLISRREALTNPTGGGQSAYLWSMLVGVMVFFGGGAVSIAESVHHLLRPAPMAYPLVGYLVLGVSIAVVGISAMQSAEVLNERRGHQALWAFLRRTTELDVIVLFVENTAAMGGLLLSLVGLVTSHVTGDPRYDAYAGLAVGGLLCLVAVWLGQQIHHLLHDEIADPDVEETFRALAAEDARIEAVLSVSTTPQGPGNVQLVAKLQLPPDVNAGEIVQIRDTLGAGVQAAHPDVRRTVIGLA